MWEKVLLERLKTHLILLIEEARNAQKLPNVLILKWESGPFHIEKSKHSFTGKTALKRLFINLSRPLHIHGREGWFRKLIQALKLFPKICLDY